MCATEMRHLLMIQRRSPRYRERLRNLFNKQRVSLSVMGTLAVSYDQQMTHLRMRYIQGRMIIMLSPLAVARARAVAVAVAVLGSRFLGC